MLKQLATTFRPNEPAVGVPRRMPLVGIFLLIAIYCVLVRVLSILNFPIWLILSIGIFVAAVSAGQASLFGGKHPRTASLWVGGLMTPVLVVGQVIYAAAASPNFLAWLSSYWLPSLFCDPHRALARIFGWAVRGELVLSVRRRAGIHRGHERHGRRRSCRCGGGNRPRAQPLDVSGSQVPSLFLELAEHEPVDDRWDDWSGHGRPRLIISQLCNAPHRAMTCVIRIFSRRDRERLQDSGLSVR